MVTFSFRVLLVSVATIGTPIPATHRHRVHRVVLLHPSEKPPPVDGYPKSPPPHIRQWSSSVAHLLPAVGRQNACMDMILSVVLHLSPLLYSLCQASAHHIAPGPPIPIHSVISVLPPLAWQPRVSPVTMGPTDPVKRASEHVRSYQIGASETTHFPRITCFSIDPEGDCL